MKEGSNLHIFHLVSFVAIFLISQDGGKRVIDAAPPLYLSFSSHKSRQRNNHCYEQRKSADGNSQQA
jgi:hypothetical protein